MFLKKVVKNLLKRCPPLSRFISRLRQREPGAWIFRQAFVFWLYQPEYFDQFPWPFKLLAWYCKVQKPFGRRIIGGLQVHRFLSALASLLSVKRVLPLKIKNDTFFIDLQDPHSFYMVSEFLKENSEARVLSALISPGDTWIDVGANLGFFALIASKLVREEGRVVLIEPQPLLAQLAEKTMAENHFAPYSIYQVACADYKGETEFYVPRSTSGRGGLYSSFSASGRHRKIRVPVVPLDDLLDWQSLPGQVFLKIDVEGSEIAVLRGARRLIQQRNPILLLEINPLSLKAAGVNPAELVSLLSHLGYSRYCEIDNVSRMASEEIGYLDFSCQRNILLWPS